MLFEKIGRKWRGVMKYYITSIIIGLTLTLTFIFALHMRFNYEEAYNEGVSLLESGDYMGAIECFNDIPDYIEYEDISELLKKYKVDNVCPYCGHVIE